MNGFENAVWTSTIKTMSNEKIALDSIVTNKNSIAHGHVSTITLTEIKNYYKDSRLLIEKFDEIIL